MSPDQEHIIIGNPQREQALKEALKEWIHRIGPDADIPSIDIGGVSLTPRLHVSFILEGNPYGIRAIQTFESLIGAQPDLGFSGLVQNLRGDELPPSSTNFLFLRFLRQL